jgi:hypothetical protein
MKYLAICLLSLASLFTTAGATPPSSPQRAATTAAPLQALEAVSVKRVFSDGSSLTDRALAAMVAAALVGMQLRRRQKSLRMPRPLSY